MMNKDFKRQLKEIALPITIQCLMQSSLSLIDQIMIGSLGSESIAGIGLAGKFTSLYSVTLAAVVTVAGILIAQYRGAKDDKGVSDSFFFPFYFALILTAVFSVLSVCAPKAIMAIYSNDASTIEKVITSPNQFAWYPNTPVKKSHLKLAKDVITRWLLEKEGYKNVGRTLPNDYFFFAGDGVHNYFRKNFDSTTYWDWSLKSPY